MGRRGTRMLGPLRALLLGSGAIEVLHMREIDIASRSHLFGHG
jgi:hypothetical protein